VSDPLRHPDRGVADFPPPPPDWPVVSLLIWLLISSFQKVHVPFNRMNCLRLREDRNSVIMALHDVSLLFTTKFGIYSL
jgi:hypothetical protein